MTGKLIAFPQDAGTSDEPSTVARARPARASLASDLRPLRRARTERDEGALAELAAEPPRELAEGITPLRREIAPTRRDVPGDPPEPVTASRRDAPTMGERLRAGPATASDSLRELIGGAAPLPPDERTTKRPAIRVLVGGRVRFVGWV